jgi:hypothetical protein
MRGSEKTDEMGKDDSPYSCACAVLCCAVLCCAVLCCAVTLATCMRPGAIRRQRACLSDRSRKPEAGRGVYLKKY